MLVTKQKTIGPRTAFFLDEGTHSSFLHSPSLTASCVRRVSEVPGASQEVINNVYVPKKMNIVALMFHVTDCDLFAL